VMSLIPSALMVVMRAGTSVARNSLTVAIFVDSARQRRSETAVEYCSLVSSVNRPEQNHSEGRISIIDDSELTKLMRYVGADNSGSAKLLLPMPLCGFHVVGARGTDPVTRTCSYRQVVLPDWQCKTKSDIPIRPIEPYLIHALPNDMATCWLLRLNLKSILWPWLWWRLDASSIPSVW
jgi:hypothetical protein